MKLWVISDTHFSHTNIIKYENRPFSNIEEMNETIINNWNKLVSPEDIIVHCGDFALCKKNDIAALVSKLNGTKILVLGNHDHFSKSFAETAGFFLAEKDYLYIKVNGKKIMFSHRPIERSLIHKDVEYYYGHVHSNNSPIENISNTHCICIERTNYLPLLLEDKISNITFFEHKMSPKYDYDREKDKSRHSEN